MGSWYSCVKCFPLTEHRMILPLHLLWDKAWLLLSGTLGRTTLQCGSERWHELDSVRKSLAGSTRRSCQLVVCWLCALLSFLLWDTRSRGHLVNVIAAKLLWHGVLRLSRKKWQCEVRVVDPGLMCHSSPHRTLILKWDPVCRQITITIIIINIIHTNYIILNYKQYHKLCICLKSKQACKQ